MMKLQLIRKDFNPLLPETPGLNGIDWKDLHFCSSTRSTIGTLRLEQKGLCSIVCRIIIVIPFFRNELHERGDTIFNLAFFFIVEVKRFSFVA